MSTLFLIGGININFEIIKKEYDKNYNNELNKACVFWAFSKEQFEKYKTHKDVPNDEYISIGYGGYIHKSNDINDRDETDKSNPNYNSFKEYIKNEYSIEEKIINLCDLMCTTKTLTVEKIMIDLLLRHGVFAKTHYHIVETIKLKEYFDNLLDYNLYDLFPEIKDNL